MKLRESFASFLSVLYIICLGNCYVSLS